VTLIAHLATALSAALLGAASFQPHPAEAQRPQAPADTARPPIPGRLYLPSNSDTLRTVPDPQSPDIAYYRDLFEVRFRDSTSGATVRRFLSRNAAVIVGGSTFLGDYTVRVPDPGPGWKSFDALVRRLNAEPGVEYAAPRTSRGGRVSDGMELWPLLPRPDRAVPADTGRPPLPSAFRFKQDTTLFAVSPQDSSVRYYRDIVVICFQDSVSGAGVRDLFARYSATVIGGLPEWPAYVVRVPDPGPGFRPLDSLVSKITHEPRVKLAYPVTMNGASTPASRFPSDGHTRRAPPDGRPPSALPKR